MSNGRERTFTDPFKHGEHVAITPTGVWLRAGNFKKFAYDNITQPNVTAYEYNQAEYEQYCQGYFKTVCDRLYSYSVTKEVHSQTHKAIKMAIPLKFSDKDGYEKLVEQAQKTHQELLQNRISGIPSTGDEEAKLIPTAPQGKTVAKPVFNRPKTPPKKPYEPPFLADFLKNQLAEAKRNATREPFNFKPITKPGVSSQLGLLSRSSSSTNINDARNNNSSSSSTASARKRKLTGQ